jgi:hypothetical protein
VSHQQLTQLLWELGVLGLQLKIEVLMVLTVYFLPFLLLVAVGVVAMIARRLLEIQEALVVAPLDLVPQQLVEPEHQDKVLPVVLVLLMKLLFGQVVVVVELVQSVEMVELLHP